MSLAHSESILRNRLVILCGIVGVISLGVASRAYPALFPAVCGKYLGDVLWALMVYLGWVFLKPTAHPTKVTAFATITAVLIELSQLIKTPGLNTLRHTTMGHLILGTVFSWADLLAYAVGIAIGFGLNTVMWFRVKHK